MTMDIGGSFGQVSEAVDFCLRMMQLFLIGSIMTVVKFLEIDLRLGKASAAGNVVRLMIEVLWLLAICYVIGVVKWYSFNEKQ